MKRSIWPSCQLRHHRRILPLAGSPCPVAFAVLEQFVERTAPFSCSALLQFQLQQQSRLRPYGKTGARIGAVDHIVPAGLPKEVFDLAWRETRRTAHLALVQEDAVALLAQSIGEGLGKRQILAAERHENTVGLRCRIPALPEQAFIGRL